MAMPRECLQHRLRERSMQASANTDLSLKLIPDSGNPSVVAVRLLAKTR